MFQQRDVGLIKTQGAEKCGFGFPNCMRFREQIGAQFLGWNVRLEAIGKLHRCCYALLDVSKNEPKLDAELCASAAAGSGSEARADAGGSRLQAVVRQRGDGM
ncbi:MAG: hypothetical protein FJZ47_15815 [Candidatus Tectomicrobia bacterium]|uniref:Uncharacterized protein n=1 Tax=Tectimicrobiota bacterium TaxID=2528274 RepID=A0A937W520_UNCTE|nr:hypothetical protein [Candidatus Tectomicrobia bacterium]